MSETATSILEIGLVLLLAAAAITIAASAVGARLFPKAEAAA